MSTNFADVLKFHTKYGLPHPEVPQLLPEDVMSFRVGFLEEELNELRDAYAKEDLAGVADALLDLVYVAMGTAVMMGLPWQLLWDEVQRANMTKVRAESQAESQAKTGRGHVFDVVKPKDFLPPRVEDLLNQYTQDQAYQGGQEGMTLELGFGGRTDAEQPENTREQDQAVQERDQLRHIGRQFANVAYHLAQGRHLDDRALADLDQLRRDWDEAIRAPSPE